MISVFASSKLRHVYSALTLGKDIRFMQVIHSNVVGIMHLDLSRQMPLMKNVMM